MINDITTGIAKKLDATFEGVPIYTEEIKQGLIEPCFFIKSVSSDQQQIVGTRYYRNHMFDVHYFPPLDGKENEHIATAVSELYEALEYIPLGAGLVRGTEMRDERIDGVLHFMVRYAFTVYRSQAADALMETVSIDTCV